MEKCLYPDNPVRLEEKERAFIADLSPCDVSDARNELFHFGCFFTDVFGFRDERCFQLRLYALHDCRITPNVG